MTVIELPDEQAALRAKAAADGLSLEGWLKQLAGTGEKARVTDRPLRHIADIILENMKDMPPEIMATMPTTGQASTTTTSTVGPSARLCYDVDHRFARR